MHVCDDEEEDEDEDVSAARSSAERGLTINMAMQIEAL